MDCSPQYVILNPGPSQLLFKNFPLFNVNSQNLNPIPIVNPFQSAPQLIIQNEKSGGVSALQQIFPANGLDHPLPRYRKILPKNDVIESEQNSEKGDVNKGAPLVDKPDKVVSNGDKSQPTSSQPTEDQQNDHAGIEVTVYLFKRGASCENYNFCTKNKQRTR